MSGSNDQPDRLLVLHRIAHAVNASLDLDETLQDVLNSVVGELGLRAAVIRLLGTDVQELQLVAATGLSEQYLQKGSVWLEESAVDRRVLSGEAVCVSDVTQESGFQYPQEAAEEGLCAMLAVSLEVRGRPIGVLRVYSGEHRAFTADDVHLIRAAADLGAVAIENARLHTALTRIAKAVNSTLELDEMLQRVLEATVMEMGLKAASVRLLDADGRTLRRVAACGLSERYLSKGRVEVAHSPADRLALRGQPVVLFDVEHEEGFQYPQEAAREGIRSVLTVPLRVKDRILGVMRVYSAQPRRFGPVAIRFLSSVADLVALATENARLHQALQARYEDLKVDVAEWYRFLALG